MKNSILIEPILSEKTTAQQETLRKYAFKVARNANKVEIKKAVEERFGVHVTKVATLNRMGKVKRTTIRSGGRVIRTEGARPAWKRAVVTLRPGESIDLFHDEQV